MSTLGRIVNSLTSVNNENTLALANLNFDFTLFKFEAPKEFLTIGGSLSLQRRDDAEQGKIHKTARKLAALFEALVPPTPNLLKAYGTRSSEIASDPKANPKGSKNHGPFAEFIGIDASSLWAAATSSAATTGTHAALSMHLLACMLARAWEADKSVSIWVELVNERQAEIDKSFEEGPQSIPTYFAARQDITREELAKWDASARSWLTSADEVKRVAKTKFMLIARNISVNLSQAKTTYQNVIDVWRHALAGIENLIQGRPQEASDGAVLLALSAWHIYPNLMVLGSSTKSVEFEDPLVQAGGVVTIGLQHARGADDVGMRWSLTLSQYRFYEREVKVDTGDGTHRVTMDELLVVALGSLFSAWHILKDEETGTANWLIKIYDLACDELGALSWLAVLSNASHKFLALQTKDEDRASCRILVGFGRRRAKKFLGFQRDRPRPFFGLLSSPLLKALSEKPGIDRGISYLRALCQTMKIPGAQYLIRYQEGGNLFGLAPLILFTTALPYSQRLTNRSLSESVDREETHYYWLAHFSGRKFESLPQGDKCMTYDPEDILESEGLPPERYFGWRNAPAFLQKDPDSWMSTGESCTILNSSNGECLCADSCDERKTSLPDLTYSLCFGDSSSFALFVHEAAPSVQDGAPIISLRDYRTRFEKAPRVHITSTSRAGSRSQLSAKEIILLLDEQKFNTKSLGQYLMHYSSRSSLGFPLFDLDMKLLLNGNALHDQQCRTVDALEFAATTFLPFNELTVPLQITSLSLADEQWQKFSDLVSYPSPGSSTKYESTPDRYMRSKPSTSYEDLVSVSTSARLLAKRFACIVSFESCSFKLRGSDFLNTFAVSFGNSILVASMLLTDPLDYGNCCDKIQRLTGNVGMPGISLLVSPVGGLKVTAPVYDLHLIPHEQYDKGRENNFQGTSLHLSFTNWRQPLNVDRQGSIDQSISFVESVISVHDRGKWVADFDILLMRPAEFPDDLGATSCCHGDERGAATSIDSWEEVVDLPENNSVVRANGNWAARLAVLAICQAKKHNRKIYLVHPENPFCVDCTLASTRRHRRRACAPSFKHTDEVEEVEEVEEDHEEEKEEEEVVVVVVEEEEDHEEEEEEEDHEEEEEEKEDGYGLTKPKYIIFID